MQGRDDHQTHALGKITSTQTPAVPKAKLGFGWAERRRNLREEGWELQNYNSAVLGEQPNTFHWVSLGSFWFFFKLFYGVILTRSNTRSLSHWKMTFQLLDGVKSHKDTCGEGDQPVPFTPFRERSCPAWSRGSWGHTCLQRQSYRVSHHIALPRVLFLLLPRAELKILGLP